MSTIETEFVRGVFYTDDLTTVAESVEFPPDSTNMSLRVKRIIFSPGDAATTVIFRRPGGGAEYFRWDVRLLGTAGDTVTHNFPFHFTEGLEIVTAAPVNNLGTTILFFATL